MGKKKYRRQTQLNFPFKYAYIIIVVLLSIIGLLSDSFFAYDEVGNSVFINIISMALYFLLLLTATAHSFYVSVWKIEKIRNAIVFGVCALLLIYLFFFNNRYWSFACLCCVFVLAIFFIVVYFISVKKGEQMPSNNIVGIALAIGFLMTFIALLSCNFVDFFYMVWLLIPAGVITAIFAFLVFFPFRNFFLSLLGSIGEMIAVVLVVFLCVFGFIWVGVSTLNVAFDGDPQIRQYEVIDKYISSGSRQVTQHQLTVIIDGKEKDIDVPTDVYWETDIGEMIDVDYYNGALGIAYYKYIPEE